MVARDGTSGVGEGDRSMQDKRIAPGASARMVPSSSSFMKPANLMGGWVLVYIGRFLPVTGLPASSAIGHPVLHIFCSTLLSILTSHWVWPMGD